MTTWAEYADWAIGRGRLMGFTRDEVLNMRPDDFMTLLQADAEMDEA